MRGGGSQDYVTLGRLGAPHGVRGWVWIVSFTDPLENLFQYRYFKIAEGTGLRTIEIDDSRPQGRSFVGHIKGCDDREESRRYTGKELLVPKRELPALESGDYYWHQLEGLRVLTLADEDLGVVDHLMETGANDVLVVRPGPGSVDQRERLVPYLPGRVVKNIDLAGGIMTVDWDADF